MLHHGAKARHAPLPRAPVLVIFRRHATKPPHSLHANHAVFKQRIQPVAKTRNFAVQRWHTCQPLCNAQAEKQGKTTVARPKGTAHQPHKNGTHLLRANVKTRLPKKTQGLPCGAKKMNCQRHPKRTWRGRAERSSRLGGKGKLHEVAAHSLPSNPRKSLDCLDLLRAGGNRAGLVLHGAPALSSNGSFRPSP